MSQDTSQVIHSLYRGERVAVVPTVCTMQDMADNLFIIPRKGTIPSVFSSIYSITVHEDDDNTLANTAATSPIFSQTPLTSSQLQK